MPELRPVDLLIEGGSIMTMDASRRIIRDGTIAVNGDRIVAVDKRDTLRGRYRGKRVVDGSRHVITPGLVNSHIHFYHQMHRGMAPDNFDGNKWSNFVHAKVAPILAVRDRLGRLIREPSGGCQAARGSRPSRAGAPRTRSIR